MIQKHWHILTSDQVLGTILPKNPQAVFKGASSLGNRIAPTVQDPPSLNIISFRTSLVTIDVKSVRSVPFTDVESEKSVSLLLPVPHVHIG